MLAEITIGREEQRRAVQRPTVALNHADHHVQRVLGGDPCQTINRRARHIHRGIEVAPELIPALGGPVPDDRPERDPTRIRRQERLGKHRQSRAARARLARQPGDLIQASLKIEAHRGRLYDGYLEANPLRAHHHRPHILGQHTRASAVIAGVREKSASQLARTATTTKRG